MKKIAIGIGIIILCMLMFMGGIRLLTRHIFDSRQCARFNIDNIELRTGIDIPKIKEVECECDDTSKMNNFILDLNEEEMKKYISINEFEQSGRGYKKNGDDEYSQWLALLNPTSKELMVYIGYKEETE